MCSSNIFSNAREANLCKFESEEDFHFALCYGPDIRVFDYIPKKPAIPWYMTLRTWRIFNLANPDIPQPISKNLFDYDFSIPVKEPVDRATVMDWMRDHYEGSPFDLTQGIFAGPFNNPNRLENGPGVMKRFGEFARAISIERTVYGVVNEPHPVGSNKSVAWFASDVPSSSVYVPFFASATNHSDYYKHGRAEYYTRDSAWWAFGFVANWMNINYNEMKNRAVGPEVTKYQKHMIEKYLEATSTNATASSLTSLQTGLQNDVVSRWLNFGNELIANFNDGVYRTPEMNSNSVHLDYPLWWLEMTGFNDNFIWVQWAKHSVTPPPMLVKQVHEIYVKYVVSPMHALKRMLKRAFLMKEEEKREEEREEKREEEREMQREVAELQELESVAASSSPFIIVGCGFSAFVGLIIVGFAKMSGGRRASLPDDQRYRHLAA